MFKFGSLIYFQSLNSHWSVFLDQIPLQLNREGIKERDDGERGGVGAILRGRRVIEGQLLFEEMRYFTFSFPREKRTRRDTLYNINLLSHLCIPRHIFCFTKINVMYTFPTWDITHPGFHLQNLKYPWKNKQICIKGSVGRWSCQRLRDGALPIA